MHCTEAMVCVDAGDDQGDTGIAAPEGAHVRSPKIAVVGTLPYLVTNLENALRGDDAVVAPDFVRAGNSVAIGVS